MPRVSHEGTILLVEDNPDDALLTGIACARAGIHNPRVLVSDGLQAVQYLLGEGEYSDRARFPVPALILLDLEMPRMNGYQVLEWLRQEPNLRHLPVIVLATSSFSPDIKYAYQLGANSFLTKPTNLTDFAAALRQLAEFWLGCCELPHHSTKSKHVGSKAPAAR